jgi:hypothetical protein
MKREPTGLSKRAALERKFLRLMEPVTLDGSSGSLVTGYFCSAVTFGSTSLTTRGACDAFVMRVTASEGAFARFMYGRGGIEVDGKAPDLCRPHYKHEILLPSYL